MKVVINRCFGGFSISDYARLWLQMRGYEKYNIPRHHSLLVECVETLGAKANGRCAKLDIVEVNNKYIIDDHDGYESIITPELLQQQIQENNWIEADAVELGM